MSDCSSKTLHVIVLGAGPAGLHSAYRLLELGIRVTVVASNFPGDDDFAYPAQWAPIIRWHQPHSHHCRVADGHGDWSEASKDEWAKAADKTGLFDTVTASSDLVRRVCVLNGSVHSTDVTATRINPVEYLHALMNRISQQPRLRLVRRYLETSSVDTDTIDDLLERATLVAEQVESTSPLDDLRPGESPRRVFVNTLPATTGDVTDKDGRFRVVYMFSAMWRYQLVKSACQVEMEDRSLSIEPCSCGRTAMLSFVFAPEPGSELGSILKSMADSPVAGLPSGPVLDAVSRLVKHAITEPNLKSFRPSEIVPAPLPTQLSTGPLSNPHSTDSLLHAFSYFCSCSSVGKHQTDISVPVPDDHRFIVFPTVSPFPLDSTVESSVESVGLVIRPSPLGWLGLQRAAGVGESVMDEFGRLVK